MTDKKRMAVRGVMAAGIAAVMAATAISSAAAEQVRRYDYATGTWQTVDAAVAARTTRTRELTQRRPDPKFERTRVRVATKEAPGTIIVDSRRKFLYLIEPGGTATRYGVGVGKEGFGWSGKMTIARKAEWPGWTPPARMIKRERAKGRNLPAYMEGGPANPLGARAMYLYRGGRDSLYRIHGTNQPWTIGRNLSSGCIRMMNEDVEHLYSRVPKGTKVLVISPSGAGPTNSYAELGPVRGPGLLSAIFGG